jgi:hypothetical protein
MAVPELAPDAAVPCRDVLLDPDAVAEVLESRLATDGGMLAIDSCERTRATYRVGAGLRVVHHIETAGRHFHVAARTFPADRIDNVLRRGLERATATDPLRPVTALPELGAVAWTFPNDRKLDTLPELGEMLTTLLGMPHHTELVNYAPEKSAAFRCIDDAGHVVAYAKVYADDTGVKTSALQDFLAGAMTGGFRVPATLGYSAPQRTLLVEPLAGRPLSALEGSGRRAAYGDYGAALAALHGLEPPPQVPVFARFAPERLVRAAERISRARPDVAPAAHALAAAIPPVEPSAPSAWLHGDSHAKNVLVADGGIALIDLDQTAAGPAAAELGSVLAALAYLRVTEGIAAREEDGFRNAFLAGYDSVRALPDEKLVAGQTAAALLAERAIRSVGRVRAEGLRCLAEVLRTARVLAEQAV